MNPRQAKSPQKKIKSIEVIFTSPQGFSLALIQWGESGTMRIGIRWDGDEGSKGYPCAHGHPTWFILPKDMAITYCEKYGAPDVVGKLSLAAEEPFKG